jgi:Uma2 family endonuclease
MTMTLISPDQGSVLLEDVSWQTYEQMLDDVGDGHLRLTFDNGRLEIVSPANPHEHIKTMIGRIVEAYADEMDIPIEGLGSTTWKSKHLQKGLEPDECYYVQHFPDIVGHAAKRKLDLSKDPPPDLAIEIDITQRSIPRQPIYAALGVPEIWRWDGNRVVSLHRNRAGKYAPATESLAFPKLDLDLLNELLGIAIDRGQPAAIKELRRRMRRDHRSK